MLLKMVVEGHVELGQPVGSKWLSQQSSVSWSPSTIRYELAELEGRGYLNHPHTSAGRVPTDRAYRLYIDELMRQRKVADVVREQVGSDLDLAGADVTRLFSAASKLLSQLSGEVGFVVAPLPSYLEPPTFPRST